MKVKVKHNLIIFEEPWQWMELKERLIKEYGVATLAISFRCRRELGFSIRDHKALRPAGGDAKGKFYYAMEVHLDFFNEAAHSWFVLKYLNR
jgi:hypothetical protein